MTGLSGWQFKYFRGKAQSSELIFTRAWRA